MILGFQTDFIPQIIAGAKVHTIRLGHRWQVGQPIYFYANAQRDDKYKFWPDGVVQAVQSIQVNEILGKISVEIDGRKLIGQELEAFSHRDGFESPSLLVHFLASYGGLPFIGQLIHWTELRY